MWSQHVGSIALLFVILITSCGSPSTSLSSQPTVDEEWDLGGFGREVSTDSEEAQLWFDRGLALTYGFHHAEAIDCFRRAQAADPDCAMAWWGAANAAGPNYNDTAMDANELAIAIECLGRAQELANHASPVERALIDALSHRYEDPAPADRSTLDRAYSDAMRNVAFEFDSDPDVLALFAESLLVLAPWKLWSPDGAPHEVTPEVMKTLEAGFEIEPDHPALCHFYIHTMEASPTPEKAEAAADRLRDRIPCSGHLRHMPSHIYIQIGRYHDANLANMKGIGCDLVTTRRTGRENFYALYRLHNYHFLVFGAMFDGRRAVAVATARELVEEVPPGMLAFMPDFLDAFVATPYHALIRFGMWDEILAEPEPQTGLFFTQAVRHYARGIAYAALGEVEEARREQEQFEAARETVPASRVLFNNPCSDILKIAAAMLEGEIAYREEDYDSAFEHLRQAVELDDALDYAEPWGWMQPSRHALGALLLEQGHLDEAEAVYRRDLERYPSNGWSLRGLASCLAQQGRNDEAKVLEKQLATAWARSDVDLYASCFCAQPVDAP